MKSTKNILTQELGKKNIYDILTEEQLLKAPLVTIEKATVFIHALDEENTDIYYILEGTAEVVSQDYNGRLFLIDTLGPGEFIGKFSHMRKKNFYCDIKTFTRCKMINLSSIRSELFNDEKFLLFFYFKTSNRLYEMYKTEMMKKLFRYEEILAYYLLKKKDAQNGCVPSIKKICFKSSISERNCHYIIKKFKNRKIIDPEKKGICILDTEKLRDIAHNITRFMENKSI